MKHKRMATISLCCAAFVVAWLAPATDCWAQHFSRAGKYELYGIAQDFDGDSVSEDGLTLDFQGTSMGGFGVGYNFNDYLNLNVDLLFGKTDVVRSGSINDTIDTDLLNLLVNLDYNVLALQVTPVVTGGIGFLNLDQSNPPSGFVPFGETDFSYTVGAGVRWDITDRFFIKGMYKILWWRLRDRDVFHQADTITLYLGIMF